MATQKQHDAVTVRTGVLTQAEFERLGPADRLRVERDAERLLTQYGPGWVEQERARLRDELSFMYGVP